MKITQKNRNQIKQFHNVINILLKTFDKETIKIIRAGMTEEFIKTVAEDESPNPQLIAKEIMRLYEE